MAAALANALLEVLRRSVPPHESMFTRTLLLGLHLPQTQRPRRLAPVDSRVPYTVTTSRSTSGQHTAPKRKIFSERYDFANTQPTAVAAGHSRQRAGIRARRPSESSLDVRCQLLPGCNPPALPCFPQALQQGDRARPNCVAMYTTESRASPRSLQGGD